MGGPMPLLSISEDALRELVDAFYGKVRRDPRIGPLFLGAVQDWPEHLERLTAFWSSVMMNSGRYKGDPLAVHGRLALTPAQFDRWLALWAETTAEQFPPPLAEALQSKAGRIAERLKLALAPRLTPQNGASRPTHPIVA